MSESDTPLKETVDSTTRTISPQKEEKGESFFDFIRFAIIAVVIVIPIRLFVAQPFVVSGASMSPTFETGHYLIIDEISYRFEEPKRGEVIVFRFPFEKKKFLIKRIVALPGETIKIQNDTVIIKNGEYPDGFEWKQGTINSSRTGAEQEVTLKDDEYFVMGDNRDESADSRLWGPLKRNFITGRPLIRLFPLTQIDLFPGKW